ncbi:MAG: hypothetical protein ACW968_13645 [Candidatus Thorarchaeota archaeon]|jgi:proteasome alpha subunit
MFGISGAGYDTSTGIFSPEGRIFAAEYAKKAVEQGATSIGILAKDGVVLLAEKKVMPLQEADSVEKISKVDEHVGVATSGFMADARQLIQEARIKSQSYWLTYEEPVPAEAVAEHISNVKVSRLSIDPVIGRGSSRAGEFLEKQYKRTIKIDAAISLALDALRQASDTELDSENVEIAKIPVKTRQFYKLTYSEIDKFLNPAEPAKKA